MAENNVVSFKRLSDNARRPFKSTSHSAGFDLAAIETFTLEPGKSSWVDTGIAFCIPEGHYGRIGSRSSLAGRDIVTGAGIVDRDYRGE